MPEGLSEGSAPVEVSVEGRTASGPSFMVEAKAPGISSVEPDSGTVGTEVIIEGMNFSATASENSITFNGTQATVKSASEDELITEVPQGAADGPIEVTVKQKSTSGPEFDVITDGTLEVHTNTTGSDRDDDRYDLSIDGDAPSSVANSGIATFPDIEQGSYQLELSAIAENCSVQGQNPRTINITAGDTTDVTFDVECQAKAKSKIAVSTFDGIGNYEIFLINPDGSNPKRITNNSTLEFNAVISNNGDKIAFSRGTNNDWDLYVMNTDGSNVQRLTQLSNLYSIYASWSPDDSKLTFSAFGSSGYENIYTINADGTNMKLLTDDKGNDTLPSWSPDGSKIVFNSDRDRPDATYNDRADGEDIITVNADGGNMQFVTENDANNEYARWSPDGSKIVFVSNRNNDNDVEIYVMDANGGNPKRLSNNSSPFDYFPSWSPNGETIVFEGENGLYTVPASGSGTAQKISNSEDYDTPFWGIVK
ncbi:MAG: DPP IV N-terminal domain-containing protein [Fodinibius sp.]|nr:DPP IV N-terminal domain-containing protein [Fodinibius sp.]